MANGTKNYTIRLAVDGEGKVTGALGKIAQDGKKTFEQIGTSSINASSRIEMLSGTFVRKLIPAITAVGSYNYLRNTVKELSDIGDTADRIGITAEKLQELRFAAENLGSNSASLDSGMQTFVKQIAEAQDGAGKLLPVLKQYNIELKDAAGNNRDAYSVMLDYADATARASSTQEQLRLTTKAFGTGSADLIELLRQGRQGIMQYAIEARNLGLVFSNDVIKKANELDNTIKRLTMILSTNGKAAAFEFVSALDEAFSSNQKFLDTASNWESFWYHVGNGAKITFLMIEDVAIGAAERIVTALDTVITKSKEGLTAIGLLEKNKFLTVQSSGLEDTLLNLRKRKSEIDQALSDQTKGNGTSSGQKIKQDLTGSGAAVRSAQNEKERKSLLGVVEALKFRNEQLGRNTEQQELYNQLQSAGVKIDSEAGREIEKLVGQYHELKKSVEANEKAQQRMETASRSAGDAVSNFFNEIVINASSAEDALLQMLRSIGTAVYQQLIGDPISDTVAGMFRDIVPRMFGGFREGGGDVEAGKAYVVGEKRAELFVPGRSGTIIPQVSGGAAPTVYIPVNVTNRSSAQVEARQGRNAQGGQSIEVMVTDSMIKSINSGKLDRTFMSRFGVRPNATGR